MAIKPDVEINENYKELDNLTPFKRCVLQNFPFIELDFDAVTNYQLLCKVVEYLNNVIDNSNKQNDNISQLEDNFKNLYDWVNTWFGNLDVQDEIDKKLDDMAEDGTLADILGLYTIRVYNTFNEVPKNLLSGVSFRIKGRNKVNDGGESNWFVTNEKPTNQYFEEINNMYYVYNDKKLNIIAVGCVDSSGKIDVDKFNTLYPSDGIYIPSGHYTADATLIPLGSVYGGSPLALPQINHVSGDVSNWRYHTNTVIESTANPIIQINDSRTIKNIIVVGNSYKQTERRELMKQGNNQPIYTKYETGEQIGIHLHDYGSMAIECAAYYCKHGIKMEYYGKITDCIVFQCSLGIYINVNDNNVINTRVYDCGTGFYISGSLNVISDCRMDGIGGIGVHVISSGNDFTNITVDYSYKCAVYLNGNYNTINGVRMRCCAQYPNTTTTINDSNFTGNCGVAINGTANTINNIMTSRPDISDDGSNIKTMNVIVGIVGGSVLTNVHFIPTYSSNTPKKDIIKCISGNAPATSFWNIFSYYSNSFTQIDDVNLLITNNYANTKQTDAPKGTLHFDGVNWFAFNGSSWKQLT